MSFEKDIILIKQLMGFLEVAKRGQIKQTAECIHMKQSNLSNLIKDLEEELNLQLFNRQAHGVSLTSSGSYVFKIANDMYKTIADIEILAKKTHMLGGTLKLWISEGICSSYIPACLNDFYVKFPQVHLEIISSLKDPDSLCDIDLGIVYHEPHFNDAFVLSKGTFYFNLYASKQYLKNYGIPKNLQDLEANHKICLRTDFENRWPKWKDLFKNAQERYLDYESRINSFNEHYVTTGFKELDEIIGGWDREEEYALVVARTNNGKSLITLKMAIAAAQAGLTVGIYSGEMSAKKVGYRADSLISHISSGYLNHGNSIVKNEYKKFIESAPNLMSGTIKVITPADVVGEVTVNVLETFIEREHLDMLVIDQVSLLSDARKGKTPVECMSNISKDIKLLQTRKRIPIIAVSQLNRSKNDDASDDTITTSMIAQSDRLDQDATCVIGISRDKKDANLLKLQVVKSRDGQVGNKLSYSCDFGRGIFTYIPEEKDNKSSSQDNLKEADDDYEARYTRTDQAGENIF